MKRRKRNKKKLLTPYDHIRKPTPRPGGAFKTRKNDLKDKESKREMNDY